MKKNNRTDDGWINVPTKTYVNRKNPGDIIEVFKDQDLPGAKIVQTTKEGSQAIYVNNEQLLKMERAFEKAAWQLQ